MSKVVAGVFLALIVGALAYLAFDPRAAADVQNWANRQLGRARHQVPDTKVMGTPSYMPVVPGGL